MAEGKGKNSKNIWKCTTCKKDFTDMKSYDSHRPGPFKICIIVQQATLAAAAARPANARARLFGEVKKMKAVKFLLWVLCLHVVSLAGIDGSPETCPANISSGCGDDWEGEFFPGIPKIKYEAPSSKNPLAFKWYNAQEEILGKKMKDWMRFSVAFWHTFCGTAGDPFGAPTKMWPWEDHTNLALSAAK